MDIEARLKRLEAEVEYLRGFVLTPIDRDTPCECGGRYKHFGRYYRKTQRAYAVKLKCRDCGQLKHFIETEAGLVPTVRMDHSLTSSRKIITTNHNGVGHGSTNAKNTSGRCENKNPSKQPGHAAA